MCVSNLMFINLKILHQFTVYKQKCKVLAKKCRPYQSPSKILLQKILQTEHSHIVGIYNATE